MTAQVFTSRVWDCWDAVFNVLSAVSWPPHPLTSKTPPVRFSGSLEVAMEMITVPGMQLPQDPTSSDAVLGVVGLDETFTLVIHTFSEVPGYVEDDPVGDPSRAVRQRLRDLSALIEQQFRDPVTGRPSGVNLLNVWNGLVTATLPAVKPIEGGYGGAVTQYLTFSARI